MEGTMNDLHITTEEMQDLKTLVEFVLNELALYTEAGGSCIDCEAATFQPHDERCFVACAERLQETVKRLTADETE
jgi:hypothetical protein